MAPQVPVPPCRFLPPAPGLTDVTRRMIEVRVGFRTRTAHGTTFGNYPLPCPRCSLPRPLCSPNAEHAPVSLVALSALASMGRSNSRGNPLAAPLHSRSLA